MIEVNGDEVLIEHYPDGESRVKLPEKALQADALGVSPFYGWNVTLRYEGDADLIHLMQVVAMLPADSAKFLHLTHVPYARMDRAAKGETYFSLREIARFINWLGFDAVMARDPHSDVCVGLLDKCGEVSCMEPLLTRVWLDSPLDPDNTTLVFPDAGAQKKYERFIGKGTSYVIGFKHRNFDDGTIESLELIEMGAQSEARGDALIIDDLSSYGGTFVRTAQTLRERGFERVYLAVAHCEPAAWDGELKEWVNHVYTTDSMVDEPKREGKRPFITRYSQTELLGRSQ